MAENTVTMDVRKPASGVAVIDIKGSITANSEDELMDAYTIATQGDTPVVLLNFNGLDYMNSSGIGLLVTLLVRANRQGHALMAFGLNEHYRHIFELTRLTDAIGVHDSEADALADAQRRSRS